MTKHTILELLLKDQWLIESQELRSFVPTVRKISVKSFPSGYSNALCKQEEEIEYAQV